MCIDEEEYQFCETQELHRMEWSLLCTASETNRSSFAFLSVLGALDGSHLIPLTS